MTAVGDQNVHPFYPPYRQVHTEPEIRTWFDKSLEERKFYEDEAKLEALRILQLKLPLNPKNLPIGVEDGEAMDMNSGKGEKLTTKSHVADILSTKFSRLVVLHHLVSCFNSIISISI